MRILITAGFMVAWFFLGLFAGRMYQERLLIRAITVGEECNRNATDMIKALRQCTGELDAARKVIHAIIDEPVEKLGAIGGETVSQKKR